MRIRKLAAIAVLAILPVLFSGEVANAQNRSYGSCYAQTSCPNGGTIYCQVYGDSSMGQSCDWWVVPGVSVECNGFVMTPYGIRWQHFYFYCY